MVVLHGTLVTFHGGEGRGKTCLTCWTFKQANAPLLKTAVHALHEVLLYHIWCIWEGWKVLTCMQVVAHNRRPDLVCNDQATETHVCQGPSASVSQDAKASWHKSGLLLSREWIWRKGGEVSPECAARSLDQNVQATRPQRALRARSGRESCVIAIRLSLLFRQWSQEVIISLRMGGLGAVKQNFVAEFLTNPRA